MHIRRGISLVEVLLTLSAVVVILTLSATLMHRAMHAQSRSRAFSDSERSALRLAEAFRRDMHAASTASVGESAGPDVLLHLELAGGPTVEYRQIAGRIERLSRVANSIQGREAFIFSAATRFTAEREPHELFVLSVVPPSASTAASEHSAGPSAAYAEIVAFRATAILGKGTSFADVSLGEEALP